MCVFCIEITVFSADLAPKFRYVLQGAIRCNLLVCSVKQLEYQLKYRCKTYKILHMHRKTRKDTIICIYKSTKFENLKNKQQRPDQTDWMHRLA